MQIYLGNKNYSSWSMRGWLALEQTGAVYEERVFNLADPGVRDEVRRHSPTGKVPALRDGDLVISDSLAIGEYLAERYPAAGLWPADPAERARARAAAAEMHSSFPALRTHMPMNVRRSSPGKGRAHGVQADIDRVSAIWRECRERAPGAYLFGDWSIADIAFAPVVSRFRTYAVEVGETERHYMEAVWSHAAVEKWRAAAEAEPMVNPLYDL